MKKIYKYSLEIEELQKIQIQKGSEILTVQDGRDGPCLWAIVDPEEEKEEITIEIYGTGETINETSKKYIGTFQQSFGERVWHVFQLYK